MSDESRRNDHKPAGHDQQAEAGEPGEGQAGPLPAFEKDPYPKMIVFCIVLSAILFLLIAGVMFFDFFYRLQRQQPAPGPGPQQHTPAHQTEAPATPPAAALPHPPFWRS